MKRAAKFRLLAVLVVFLAILFFYLNIFAPALMPKLFRCGGLRAPTNILIIGTDLNFDIVTGKPLPGMEGRTDTIVLAHLDPARYRINLLSIPRDTLVQIPGYGMQKINAAHVYGGIRLTEQTVTQLIGVKIDNYVEVNPRAIIKLVDLLGGVLLVVEKDLRYVDKAQGLDINLKQGWRRLSGKQAHDYIRFRHDAMGDIGRVERQQHFLKALNQTLKRPANIIKAPFAIMIALRQIKTDLAVAKVVRLLFFVRSLGDNDIRTVTLSGEALDVQGVGSSWVANKSDLAKIIKEFF